VEGYSYKEALIAEYENVFKSYDVEVAIGRSQVTVVDLLSHKRQ
jgi:hypothetical protein